MQIKTKNIFEYLNRTGLNLVLGNCDSLLLSERGPPHPPALYFFVQIYKTNTKYKTMKIRVEHNQQNSQIQNTTLTNT